LLPCAPAATLREVVMRLAGKLGRAIKVAQVPRWIVKAAAVAVPLMRELDEMLYQWDEPFVVDDSRFRERFHIDPIDLDRAASATVEWAIHYYGSPAAA
jgi:hypothetical protein